MDDRELMAESLKELEFANVLQKIKTYCYSDIGIENILKLWPSGDIPMLRHEHDLIEEFITLLTEDDPLPLEGLSDVRPYLHKSQVQNAVLNATDILAVKDVIRVSRLIKKFFQSRKERYNALIEESLNLYQNMFLEKHISDAIDENGEVKDNASRELARIRRSIFEKSNRLRSRLDKILKQVIEEDFAREDFVTLSEGRFVLPVKVEHKRHLPGIIHGVSQTGATVFIEPSEIIEMNNELSLLVNEEKREVYRILSNLTAEIGDEASRFLHSVDIIGRMDAAMAKAKYALEFGGAKPRIHEENSVYLANIRHPLLVHSKGIKKVLPLSLEFSDDKRGHLISGPNAGGKTVALKSIGLSIAMALSGIFPLGECHTNPRVIFTSIGDHQSIENDLSTFSSQVINLKNILENCTKESLVLIDEIGSGTDPQEGAALAAGILDSFIAMNLFFVATTHQSSLKTYALNRDVIENASLEFDDKMLKPTYKFLTGIPGNSYAFVLAEDLGMSKLVIERALKYLGSREKELEESISVLSKYRSEIEDLKMKSAKELLQAEETKKKFETKFSNIKEKRQEFIDEAKREAAEIISGANALIENTIREIKEEKRSFTEIKQDFGREKKAIEKRAEALFEAEKKRDKPDTSFSEGDSVMLDETQSVGTILDIYRDAETALVEFNGLKFKLALSQLTKTAAPKKKKSSYTDNIKFDVQTKLDLRGKRAEEALRETDEFIADAVSGGLANLTIIHGKGTGALRTAVHDLLKHHHQVKSYRLGELVEGGAGVTIVEL